MTIKVGSLCTGIGGLELGLECLGLDFELAWIAESNPDVAPIWDDFKGPNFGDITADWDWGKVPKVDLLLIGPPVPQLIIPDERWLWPALLNVIVQTGVPVTMIEAPRSLLSVRKGAVWAQVTAELAAAGYRTYWLVIGACHMGVAHHRHRLFFAAVKAPDGEQVEPGAIRVPIGMSCGALDSATLAPAAVKDPTSLQRWTQGRRFPATMNMMPSPGPSDATKGGPNQRGSDGKPLLTAAVQQRWLPQFAPVLAHHANLYGSPPLPTEPNGRHAPRLTAPFVEWLMCFPKGHVSDVLPRREALLALGHATCPPQAALAYGLLTEFALASIPGQE